MCIPISALFYLKGCKIHSLSLAFSPITTQVKIFPSPDMEISAPTCQSGSVSRLQEKERLYFLTKALEFTTFIFLRAAGDWVNGDITESPPTKATPL